MRIGYCATSELILTFIYTEVVVTHLTTVPRQMRMASVTAVSVMKKVL